MAIITTPQRDIPRVTSAKPITENPSTGMLLRILSGLLFAGMSICVKQSRQRFRSARSSFPFGVRAHPTGDFPMDSGGVPARACDKFARQDHRLNLIDGK